MASSLVLQSPAHLLNGSLFNEPNEQGINMTSELVELTPTELKVGMFVSKLDRPWSETPFLMQGFFVQSPEDIKRLKKLCKTVYIDANRAGKTAQKKQTNETAPAKIPQRQRPISVGRRMESPDASIDASPRKSINKYREQYEDFCAHLRHITESAMITRTLDARSLEKLAKDLLNTTLKNSDALLWLCKANQSIANDYHRTIEATIWAILFGQYLQVIRTDLELLAQGMLLTAYTTHNLPSSLLIHSHALSAGELSLIAKHIKQTEDLLQRSDANQRINNITSCLWEKYDGTGYPNGIKEEAITPLARIAGITNYYTSLIYHHQKEGKPLSPADATANLYALRDAAFQDILVCELIQSIGLYPTGTLVQLSTQEVGVIIHQNHVNRLYPKILIILNENLVPIKKCRIVNLATNKGKHACNIAKTLSVKEYDIDFNDVDENLIVEKSAWANLVDMF